MDFVHDQLFYGTKIRALTIVDTLTRLSPVVDVRQSYRGGDVVDTLDAASLNLVIRGRSGSYNGPEFVSRELDLWAYMKRVTLDFSRPGKPTDNAFIESFNGKFRAECLNANCPRLGLHRDVIRELIHRGLTFLSRSSHHRFVSSGSKFFTVPKYQTAVRRGISVGTP